MLPCDGRARKRCRFVAGHVADRPSDLAHSLHECEDESIAQSQGLTLSLDDPARLLTCRAGAQVFRHIQGLIDEVQFNGDLETRAEPRLQLIGPVVGLDSRVIVRTWLKHDDLDAEFVSYALVEFDQADAEARLHPVEQRHEIAWIF